MKKYQGVIFDLDGLLFDTERLYYEATQAIADEMQIPYDESIYHRYIGISDEELWAHYHQMYDSTFGKEFVNAFINNAFHRSVELFESGQAQLKEGVLELLAYLNEKKIKKVIASSNQRRLIDILLEKNQLVHEFERVFSVEDVKRAKPDPELFEKAADFLAIEKNQLLILEDSKNGVLAAHRAKIDVIMIPDLIAPSVELKEKTIQVLPSLLNLLSFIQS